MIRASAAATWRMSPRRAAWRLVIVAALLFGLVWWLAPPWGAFQAAGHVVPAGRVVDAAAPRGARGSAVARSVAAEGEPTGRLQQARLDAHWRRLLRDGDPRQRMLALRMLQAGKRDLAARRAAQRQAARIAAEVPDDPLLAIMQRWFCQRLPEGCTGTAREAWSRAEPDNAAARLDMLSDAIDDASRFDAILADAARRERYDSHDLALARETVVLFDEVPLPRMSHEERRLLDELRLPHTDESRRLMMSIGAVAALPMSALAGVSRGCRPPVSPQRARDCRTVLLRMTRATTNIERIVAYSTLERLTRGTAEGVVWAMHNRRLRWWMHQLPMLTTGIDYWRDMLQFGEVEATRRLVLNAGIPLDPPAGWAPRRY